eukprot:scpid106139/ scgid22481/ 
MPLQMLVFSGCFLYVATACGTGADLAAASQHRSADVARPRVTGDMIGGREANRTHGKAADILLSQKYYTSDLHIQTELERTNSKLKLTQHDAESTEARRRR